MIKKSYKSFHRKEQKVAQENYYKINLIRTLTNINLFLPS